MASSLPPPVSPSTGSVAMDDIDVHDLKEAEEEERQARHQRLADKHNNCDDLFQDIASSPDVVHIPLDEFQCVVCRNLVECISFSDCGHVWCNSCHSRIRKCPICRVSVTTLRNDNSFVCRLLRRYCERKCSNCPWKGGLLDLVGHNKMCPKGVISCDTCTERMTRDKAETHIGVCPMREVTCSRCKEIILVKDKEYHDTCTCKAKEVVCEFCQKHHSSEEEWIQHVKYECRQRNVPCKGCGETLKACNYDAHQLSCSFRSVGCIDCDENVPSCLMDEHRQRICRYRLLECQACRKYIPGKDFRAHVQGKELLCVCDNT